MQGSSATETANSLLDAAQDIAAQFVYTDNDVRRCVLQFIEEMNEGLRERTPAMCQIPTYITRVAQGSERGLCLAVDLGGTNLRVCSVDLHGNRTFSVEQSKIAISPQLMVVQDPSQLFFFIATQIMNFLNIHHRDYLKYCERGNQQPLSLGFAFSYPAYQTSIRSGILLRWTKGIDIPGVVGEDVCQLLQQEIDLLQLPVRVTALVNDAAGTIMSRAYTLPISQTRTSIGAIFGTGTNCVYREKLENISKDLDGDYDRSTGEMFISIEWGSFNNSLSVLPNTPYDEEVNSSSVNPGNQMFEKRVSGMFLGELLRIVLLQMHDDPQIKLFGGGDPSGASLGTSLPLRTRWSVDSSILSTAEADKSDTLILLKEDIKVRLGVSATMITSSDAWAVKTIACAIGRRAARLAGMAIGAVVLQSQRSGGIQPPSHKPNISGIAASSGILNKKEILYAPVLKDSIPAMSKEAYTTSPESTATEALLEEEVIDIGVDGSVIENYPYFEVYLREALRSIDEIGVVNEKNIRIGIAKDGSSVGAAIIALLASQSTLALPGLTKAVPGPLRLSAF